MEAYMKLISLGDAKAAAAEMTNLEKFLATHTSRITSLFRYFDFDGDGLITRMDLRTGLQSIAEVYKEEFQDDDVDKLINRIFGGTNFKI
mmetsp:Transcript_23473/g.37717  ORF Transcript_23473/g.37717 Transcript_23473/m.37717 type:complete len:90 (+) Transcript_23473:1760-2029(+)